MSYSAFSATSGGSRSDRLADLCSDSLARSTLSHDFNHLPDFVLWVHGLDDPIIRFGFAWIMLPVLGWVPHPVMSYIQPGPTFSRVRHPVVSCLCHSAVLPTLRDRNLINVVIETLRDRDCIHSDQWWINDDQRRDRCNRWRDTIRGRTSDDQR